MHAMERVLLYSVSLVCGLTLLFGPQSGASSDQHQSNTNEAQQGDSSPARSKVTIDDSRPNMARADNPMETTVESLSLVDEKGRERLTLEMTPRGYPRIRFKNEKGAAVLDLASGPDDTASIALIGEKGRIGIATRPDGDLQLELRHHQGGHTNMLVGDDGVTEVSTGQRDGSEVRLQTDHEGNAAVAIHRPDETPGPVMKLFGDGLAEIAVHGANSDDGPSMIRLPDGVSVIAAKYPNGEPAASLISSPNGTAVMAVTSSDGKQQASLRIKENGDADLELTEPKQPGENENVPAPARDVRRNIDSARQ